MTTKISAARVVENELDFEAGVLAWCFSEAATMIRNGSSSLCTRERMEAFESLLWTLVRVWRSRHVGVSASVFQEILQQAFSGQDKHWTAVIQEQLTATMPLLKFFSVIRLLRLGRPVPINDREKAAELCRWASARFKTLSSGPRYQGECRL